VADSFFENPILNSPYFVPTRHHALDKDGQRLDEPPAQGRRRSELITPVPKPRKKNNKPEQGKLALGDKEGLSTAEQEYNPTPIIDDAEFHNGQRRV
jgi:type III restriction enzyme